MNVAVSLFRRHWRGLLSARPEGFAWLKVAGKDSTADMLAIDPRLGNSASNCAAGNIALLDLALSRLPGPFRHNVLVRPAT